MSVSGACTQTKTSCAQVVEKNNGPDTVAVIVAGGIGERFGYPGGKQFINLCGVQCHLGANVCRLHTFAVC